MGERWREAAPDRVLGCQGTDVGVLVEMWRLVDKGRPVPTPRRQIQREAGSAGLTWGDAPEWKGPWVQSGNRAGGTMHRLSHRGSWVQPEGRTPTIT